MCFCVLELQWINSRTIVLLDSVEKLHVIDRQTQEELETVEISEVQLVYNSSHFKSLATGGNVSQALVRIICYFSIVLINLIFCCFKNSEEFLCLDVSLKTTATVATISVLVATISLLETTFLLPLSPVASCLKRQRSLQHFLAGFTQAAAAQVNNMLSQAIPMQCPHSLWSSEIPKTHSDQRKSNKPC